MIPSDWMFWILIGWFLLGVLASALGARNGWKPGTAFLLGFLLGPIGLMVVLIIRVGAPKDESVPWIDRA